VPFLFALFCLKGFDTRQRFLFCTLISLVGYITLSLIFSGHFLINVLILLLMVTLVTLSCRRRLRDANHLSAVQILPGLILLVFGLLNLSINHDYIDYLFIVPLLTIVYFLRYPAHPNKDKIQYIFGYAGPVDLSIYQQVSNTRVGSNRRIEPKLVTFHSDQDLLTDELHSEALVNKAIAEGNSRNDYPLCTDDKVNDFTDHDSTQSRQGELNNFFKKIQCYWVNNSNLRFSALVVLTLSVSFILINTVINVFNPSTEIASQTEFKNNQDQTITNKTNDIDFIDKQHLLAMPDKFNVYLSQYQGLIIHWQADNINVSELWSQLSNQGDKSCQQITFNKGKAIRPLSVKVENNIDYFANFSPLDTSELIKALAFRGKFSLCGYNFSLRGSQALFGKHNQYAVFLEQAG